MNCSLTPALCVQLLSQLSTVVVDKGALQQPNPKFTFPQTLTLPSNQPIPSSVPAVPIRFSSYSAVGSNIHGINSMTLHPGSMEPRQVPGSYRMYSMRFCPYAERVLIYLTKKNIPVEVINVNPDQSPQWYLAKSPLGRVPSLEINGKVVWESNVVAEYLDELFPSNSILPKDPYEKAHQKILVERLSPIINVVFDLFRSTQPHVQRQTDQNVHSAMRNAENLLRDSYFGGRTPGYADYMIWPFLERLELLTMTPTSSFRYFPGLHYPKMGAYIARMQSQSEIKFVMRPLAHHKGYVDSFSMGRPNYDYGIFGGK